MSSFHYLLHCHITLFQAIRHWQYVLSFLRFKFQELRIPLHKLNHNYSDLSQGQVLSYARSRSTTKYHRNKILLLHAFFGLPPLRNKFRRVFENIGVTQKTYPLSCNARPLLKTNSSNLNIFYDLPIKNTSRRNETRYFVDHTIQIRQFFHVINSYILIWLDNRVNLRFESWYDFWFFEDK